MKIFLRFSFLLFLLINLSFEGTKHLVDNLFEGYDYNQDIYSGYLETLIEGNELFYIYTPSQSDPENDDILLWLNGGPGCSSLFGFLAEIGPVSTDNFSGKYKKNEYAWNKNLNILYIEQPAGVGFSTVSDPDFTWNETITANNLLAAIKDFFDTFPEEKSKSFYISGESYAGVYVPYLTQAILDDKTETKVNFQGFFIGNPYTDFITDDRSLAEYGFWHGIVSSEVYDAYERNCPHLNDEIRPLSEPYSGEVGQLDTFNVTTKCNKALIKISESYDCIDIYGINRICPIYYYENNESNFLLNRELGMRRTILNRLIKNKDHIIRKNKLHLEPEESMWPYYYCDEDITVDKFLNLETIKDKLDVKNKSLEWTQCNDINYNMTESVLFYNTTMKEHKDLKFWIYSGTDDCVCSLIGTQRWINKLGLKMEGKIDQWKVDGQVSGYDQKYEEGLTLVSFKGAGHMVPQDKRKEAKFVLDSFLKGIRPSENKS